MCLWLSRSDSSVLSTSRSPLNPGSSAQRHQATRGGTPQASRAQSEPARSKAETEGGQSFRFGPRCKRPTRLVDRLLMIRHLAGDFGPCQALSDDLAHSHIKAVTIGQRLPVAILPVVEAKRLFIEIAEQVEGFHADVSSVQSALQQAPEVFHRVRMDVAANVLNSMVNHLMSVIGLQPIVGQQKIGVDGATGVGDGGDGAVVGIGDRRRIRREASARRFRRGSAASIAPADRRDSDTPDSRSYSASRDSAT